MNLKMKPATYICRHAHKSCQFSLTQILCKRNEGQSVNLGKAFNVRFIEISFSLSFKLKMFSFHF